MTLTTHVKQDNGTYYLSWEDNNISGYKLTEMAQPNGFLNDLPGTLEFMTFSQLKEKNNCLVTSELSGGRMNFIRAYQAYLETQNISWLFVKADAWEKVVFQCSTKFKPSDDFLEAIAALKTEEGIGARMALLKEWLTEKTKQTATLEPENIVLILRGVSTLKKLEAEEITIIFRQLFDTGIVAQATNKFSILIIDTFDSIFTDAAETSGYANLCYQYRLPFLDANDIKILVKELALKFTPELSPKKVTKAETDRQAVSRLLEHTGGQPLLVQDFLRRLQLLKKPITPRLIERVAKNMRANPPVITKKWQKELEKILKKEHELIHPLQAYVSGFSLSSMRMPPPAQERSLFLAGWLNFSKERWGISSTLHANLARPILEKVIQDLANPVLKQAKKDLV